MLFCTGGGGDPVDSRSGPRSPDVLRGDTDCGGGGIAVGTSGRGEEEREAGCERAWSRGGICGGASSPLPRETELQRDWEGGLWEGLYLVWRKGGAGLRGGRTGRCCCC